ncbi:flippase [Herminiimonas aquatilis]|uniref:Flippase n=1 Tax=Herminiimonas aquatilis TaxID=345342 RepID=A0ABW2J9E4_9BURK
MSRLIRQYFNNVKSHQGFRRYFENTSWMFAEQVLRMAAGLFVGIWVARYLGPEQYGVFSYAIAFVSIFSSVAKLGLDSIVVRDLVRDPNQRDIYLGTAFWLKLGGALLTLGAVTLAVQYTENDHLTNLYILIIASGSIFQSFEVVDFYFQSKVLSKFVSLCRITQLVLSSLLKIYLVLTGADLLWFVAVSLIDQATLAVSLYLAYRYQRHGNFFKYFDLPLAKNLLRDSWPLILSGFVLMIQARIDQVMLKALVGNAEVGYYSSAMRLIEIFSFIPMILTTSLFPAIVNAKNMSVSVYKDRLSHLYKFMMLLFLGVAIPIYFFGNEIVIFLYKDAYAPAGYLFSLMALRLFFTNYGAARGAYLMAENLTRYALITLIIGAVVNVLLNYLLIPIYHSKGAIFASLVSFFVATFLLDFCYGKTRENFKIMMASMLFMNPKRKSC